MNKLAIVIFSTLIPFIGYAQRTDKNTLIQTVPYDSLTNFLGNNVAQYTGQELWLKELPTNQQSGGYSNFILKYKKDDNLLNDPKNVYKCCDGYNSKYTELANKHFIVLDVLKHPKAHKDNEEYGDEYYLKLEEKSGGDIVYFKYDVNSEYTFPFVVTGYLAKQKELYVGKQYVFTSDVLSGVRDTKTQKAIQAPIGQIWKCTDITIGNKDYEICMVIQNAQGLSTVVPLSTIKNEQLPRKSYTVEEASTMKKRFGINSYNRILQQKIGMNMTKEMCRLSWGEPLEIKQGEKKGAKTEEWVYPAGSLIFRGDKLIKI